MKSSTLKGIVLAIAAAGAVTAFNFMPAKTALQGKKAPDFSAIATDGKKHSLDGELKDGMVFMYFIKEGCPVNHQAAPHVLKLWKAYGQKSSLLGVYSGSVSEAKSWASRYKSGSMPILEDPSLKVIRAYGAAYSPWLVVVGKDGKVAKVFEGAAPKELEQVNAMMASNAGVTKASLSFVGSPTGGG